MHDKASLWHNEKDRLVHVQPGALDKNSTGGYHLAVTQQPAVDDPSGTSESCTLETFEAPVDDVMDGGELISGYFTPPESGEYVFSLAADDGRPTIADSMRVAQCHAEALGLGSRRHSAPVSRTLCRVAFLR